MSHRVTPLPYQQEASKQMAAALQEQQGVILLSGTGTGKTLMGLLTALKMLARRPDDDNRPYLVCVVSPSAGGNVTEQWQREARRLGVANCAIYVGRKKDEYYETWRRNALPGRVSVLITTPQTVLYSTAGVKNHPGAGKASPLASTEFDLLIYDEAHGLRNGSSRDDEAPVDVTKQGYCALDKYLRRRNPRMKWLLVTATPITNDALDLYSAVRFFVSSDKRVWLRRDEADPKWKDIKEEMVDRFIYVPPDVPTVPETQVREVEVTAHPSEAGQLAVQTEGLVTAALALQTACSELKRASPADKPARRKEYERCLKGFRMFFTRVRRMLCHPYLVQANPLDPKADPDKKKRLRVDVDAAVKAWPWDACSKFVALEAAVREYADTKVLVYSEWSDVVDLAVRFLCERFPERGILKHHGGVHNVHRTMAEFKASEENLVICCTRGSTATGVDIDTAGASGHPVHIVNMDQALSDTDRRQSLGRVKRPAAGRTFTRPYTADDLMTVVRDGEKTRETVDHVLTWMQREKRRRALAVLASDEERREAEICDKTDEVVSSSIIGKLVQMLGDEEPRKRRKKTDADSGGR